MHSRRTQVLALVLRRGGAVCERGRCRKLCPPGAAGVVGGLSGGGTKLDRRLDCVAGLIVPFCSPSSLFI